MSAVFDRDIQREIRSGNRQILAKAITNLENSNSDIQIPKVENPIQVLGITGAPGVGKSTTVDAIVKYLRKKIYQLPFLRLTHHHQSQVVHY